MNYYNDNDRNAALWLKSLVKAHLIPDGYVDDQSIEELRATDLAEYTQCHFFAGIGGWSRALELAGWPSNRLVWTGSCPCQPFSIAGKGKGTSDKRHLWPVWYELIKESMPDTIFGEQVASPLGREWLAGVQTDMEALGYSFGAADLCIAGVGSPHIRQRLWWVADSDGSVRQPGGPRPDKRTGENDNQEPSRRLADSDNIRREYGQEERRGDRATHGETEHRQQPGQDGKACGMGNTESQRRQPLTRGSQQLQGQNGQESWNELTSTEPACRMGQPDTARPQGYGQLGECTTEGTTSPPNFWSDFDIVQCRDGKQRRIEPGTFPLAHGVSGRVAKLRGLGNSIAPQVAAVFIRAFRGVSDKESYE